MYSPSSYRRCQMMMLPMLSRPRSFGSGLFECFLGSAAQVAMPVYLPSVSSWNLTRPSLSRTSQSPTIAPSAGFALSDAGSAATARAGAATSGSVCSSATAIAVLVRMAADLLCLSSGSDAQHVAVDAPPGAANEQANANVDNVSGQRPRRYDPTCTRS